MAAKTEEPTKIPVSDDSLFPTTTVEARGRSFTFRELSAQEYDSCVENATHDGQLDTVQLLRWMIIKGSVDPKLTAADVGALPFGVVGLIGKAVNDLHFGEEDLAPLADRLRQAGWSVSAPETEGPKG